MLKKVQKAPKNDQKLTKNDKTFMLLMEDCRGSFAKATKPRNDIIL